MESLKTFHLPLGFGFHRRDADFISHYLREKLLGHKVEFEVRPEVDIYKHETWDLPAMVEREAMQQHKKGGFRTKGGFKTMPFILAFEFCDKFTTSGLNSNMITYLTQQLHLPLVESSNIISNLHGASGFTPIVGALIADSIAGRFCTIAVGSAIYLLGMVNLTMSSVLPGLHPGQCNDQGTCHRASAWQLLVFYSSVLFTSIGSGGIRPCVVTFGADQFKNYDDVGSKQAHKGSFFNLYYMAHSFGSLVALTLVVHVQDKVGWGWGFGMPTIAMFISLAVFLVGYPFYITLKPEGSSLTRFAQVLVAAFRKRKAATPIDSKLLYQDKELDVQHSTDGKLLHTDQLRFLDRAATMAAGDMNEVGKPLPWRLSTVHHVEELKSLIRMLPIWSVGIMMMASVSHNHSFSIQQARTMDRRFPHGLEIRPATMTIFSVATAILSIALYDRAFVPLARRVTGRPSGITCLQRMGVGLAITVLCNVSAALVEGKRRRVAKEHGFLDDPRAVLPISVFWMVPQHVIHGVGQAFAHVGHMEFLCDQIPESMRSTGATMFCLSGAIGSYVGTVIVTIVQGLTNGRGEWLQDNINRGRLDYYYWLVATLQAINFFYFLVCSTLYTSHDRDIKVTETNKGDVEESREAMGL